MVIDPTKRNSENILGVLPTAFFSIRLKDEGEVAELKTNS
jgi:hypothetical protein